MSKRFGFDSNNQFNSIKMLDILNWLLCLKKQKPCKCVKVCVLTWLILLGHLFVVVLFLSRLSTTTVCINWENKRKVKGGQAGKMTRPSHIPNCNLILLSFYAIFIRNLYTNFGLHRKMKNFLKISVFSLSFSFTKIPKDETDQKST